MSRSLRPHRSGLCLIALLLALLVAAPAAGAAQYGGPPTANGGTYLALGDSLAFGYQGYKVAGCQASHCLSPDTQFNTGYVNQFATLFGATYPGVTTVNLGCPGETSGTLINATNGSTGCTTYSFPLHYNHPGKTQLQTAVQVLRERGKKVNPITVNIGANDLLGLVRDCGGTTQLSCINGNAANTIGGIAANLDTTLNTLRAEGGKTKEIVVIGQYNPLYVAVLGPPTAPPPPFVFNPANIVPAAGTDVLANNVNAAMVTVAAKYHADFADPMPTFNPGNGSNPAGEFLSICQKTLMCTPPLTQTGNPGGDVHASDVGYAALAGLVNTASGY